MMNNLNNEKFVHFSNRRNCIQNSVNLHSRRLLVRQSVPHMNTATYI